MRRRQQNWPRLKRQQLLQGRRRLRRRLPRQPFLRLHQEDLCQALGLLPASKYQNEGGPTPRQISELLRQHSSDPDADVNAFADALIFNWLIAGTDAHAKNYSVLHAAGGRIRLAPLYDLASALLYPDLDQHRISLAMRIGSVYRIRDVGRPQWMDLAKDIRLEPDHVIDRARDLAGQIPERVSEIAAHMAANGLDSAVVNKLAELLSGHARRCLSSLRA
jgi:serine/threonine-protein kinase HipA